MSEMNIMNVQKMAKCFYHLKLQAPATTAATNATTPLGAVHTVLPDPFDWPSDVLP
jgi:hypothetical protein